MNRPACSLRRSDQECNTEHLLCGLRADEERDDGDDKRRPETVLISPAPGRRGGVSHGCRHEPPPAHVDSGQV